MVVQSPMGALKKRALLAKQRMRMGYWQHIKEERDQMLEGCCGKANSVELVKKVQREQVIREDSIALGTKSDLLDEALYKRVSLILDEDENVLNPIGRLVDQSELAKLDDSNRQKYILNLSRKFCEMKERYFQEKLSGCHANVL